ncbi:MAG: hypothetical protein FVQ83_01960 [Chloroflexi bacterium]|nr:hypothetical protein [Chloroflexota bacterium]
MKSDPLVGIVGPSKSGKSTLKKGLEANGYRVRHIAQEHSFAPSMWKLISNPDVLIFLDVAYPQTLERGQPSWTQEEYNEEIQRLEHAREHANLYINTNEVTSDETLAAALDFLGKN